MYGAHTLDTRPLKPSILGQDNTWHTGVRRTTAHGSFLCAWAVCNTLTFHMLHVHLVLGVAMMDGTTPSTQWWAAMEGNVQFFDS